MSKRDRNMEVSDVERSEEKGLGGGKKKEMTTEAMRFDL